MAGGVSLLTKLLGVMASAISGVMGFPAVTFCLKSVAMFMAGLNSTMAFGLAEMLLSSDSAS